MFLVIGQGKNLALHRTDVFRGGSRGRNWGDLPS